MDNLKVTAAGAYPFLELTDKKFLKHCRLDAYMASGHGGQKRNRTYSAIRLTHIETGISVIAAESRSQMENKIKAIRRLRQALALNIRQNIHHNHFTIPNSLKNLLHPDAPLQINKKNPLYPAFCAVLLDAIYLQEGQIGKVSKALPVSTGKLSRLLKKDKNLLVSANKIRIHFNLRPLKAF